MQVAGYTKKQTNKQQKKQQAYSLDPTTSEWNHYAAVQACANLSGNELKRNSSGNIQPQLSQLVEQLWTDPGLKSGNSVRELISTLKKKKVWRGMNA